MRVQGRLDLVQANLDFYCRLTSTSNLRKVEDLRSFYYSRFLDDARKGLKSIVSSKAEVVEDNSKEKEEIHSSASSFLSAVSSQQNSEDTVTEVQDSAGSFLNAVQTLNNSIGDGVKPVKGICLDDIIADTGFEVAEVHGVYLDDVVVKTHEVVKEDIHGVLLDDVVVAEVISSIPEETISLPDIHGVCLDEVKTPNNVVIEVKEDIHGVYLDEVKTPNKVVIEVKEDIHGVYLDDVVSIQEEIKVIEKPISSDIFEEPEYVDEVEAEEPIVEPIKAESKIVPINDKVDISRLGVVVPPTVREFLKKHSGCDMSEVERYYSKKVIQKELKMGKIYKKGNKLFI